MGGRDAFVDGNVLAMAVLYLCRSPKNHETDDLKNHVEGRVKSGWRAEIPDHALDAHTSRGKALKRGMKHFYEEARLLVNEQGRNDYANSDFIDRGRA